MRQQLPQVVARQSRGRHAEAGRHREVRSLIVFCHACDRHPQGFGQHARLVQFTIGQHDPELLAAQPTKQID